jgi:hypothetical protein
MAVSATVSPGIVLVDGAAITISDLNKLGTPTVDISGAVGSLSLSDGSVTNAKIQAATGIQYDKLETLATGELVVGNAGTATATALSGDATIAADGSLTLAADVALASGVTATTQAEDTDNTAIATTAFVERDVTTHAALRSAEEVFGHAKIYVTDSVLYIETS